VSFCSGGIAGSQNGLSLFSTATSARIWKAHPRRKAHAREID